MRCTKNIAATASTPSAIHSTRRSPREPLVSGRTSSGARSSAPDAACGGSYGLSAGFIHLSYLMPVLLLAPIANYLAYLLYVNVQKNEILGRH